MPDLWANIQLCIENLWPLYPVFLNDRTIAWFINQHDFLQFNYSFCDYCWSILISFQTSDTQTSVRSISIPFSYAILSTPLPLLFNCKPQIYVVFDFRGQGSEMLTLLAYRPYMHRVTHIMITRTFRPKTLWTIEWPYRQSRIHDVTSITVSFRYYDCHYYHCKIHDCYFW